MTLKLLRKMNGINLLEKNTVVLNEIPITLSNNLFLVSIFFSARRIVCSEGQNVSGNQFSFPASTDVFITLVFFS